MTATTIRVMYRRQVQPASYEAAEAVVEATAVVEHENWSKASAEMLAKCREQALVAVGKAPAKAAEAVAEKIEEDAPKPPKASKPAKPTKPTKSKPEPAKAKPEPEAEEAEDWEKAAEETVKVEEISDQVLQAAATKRAQKDKDGITFVKGLMAEFGVERLGALTQEQRAAFLAELDA